MNRSALSEHQLRLHQLCPHQICHIAALEQELFERPLSASALTSLFDGAAFHGWTIDPGDGNADLPCAYLLAHVVEEQAEILSLGVAPSYQRQGLASFLLRSVTSELSGQQVRTVFLEVATDNEAAIGLYAGLGFEKTSVRKNYYRRDHGWCDAHMMQLDLTVAFS